jgi:hypothetical protein
MLLLLPAVMAQELQNRANLQQELLLLPLVPEQVALISGPAWGLEPQRNEEALKLEQPLRLGVGLEEPTVRKQQQQQPHHPLHSIASSHTHPPQTV